MLVVLQLRAPLAQLLLRVQQQPKVAAPRLGGAMVEAALAAVAPIPSAPHLLDGIWVVPVGKLACDGAVHITPCGAHAHTCALAAGE